MVGVPWQRIGHHFALGGEALRNEPHSLGANARRGELFGHFVHYPLQVLDERRIVVAARAALAAPLLGSPSVGEAVQELLHVFHPILDAEIVLRKRRLQRVVRDDSLDDRFRFAFCVSPCSSRWKASLSSISA